MLQHPKTCWLRRFQTPLPNLVAKKTVDSTDHELIQADSLRVVGDARCQECFYQQQRVRQFVHREFLMARYQSVRPMEIAQKESKSSWGLDSTFVQFRWWSQQSCSRLQKISDWLTPRQQ
jgi:Cu2+-containing amine oxidase